VLLIEHQDGARDLAGLHGPEGVVDVGQLAAPGDHLVELEPALPVELDVARHVDLEPVASHAAALDLLLPQEHGAVELDLLPDGDHPDDGRRAARPERVEALLGRQLQPDRLERVVDAATGHRADGLHRIVRLRVHRVGGAELARRGELRVHRVDGDDHARAADARALDGGEPDAARTEDGNRRARLDPRGVEHGADAGGDAAADEGGAVQRHLHVDLHERVLVHQHLLGVRGEVGELVHGLAVPGELRRLRLGTDGACLAEKRLAGEAVLALAAEHRQAGDHVIARRELRDLGADRLDDAGCLVPEDGRRRERVEAVDEVQVAVANARGHRPHADFPAARRVDVDGLDGERLVGSVKDGSVHGNLPKSMIRGILPQARTLCRGGQHHDRTADAGRLPGAGGDRLRGP
jgi:hypothetical protein